MLEIHVLERFIQYNCIVHNKYIFEMSGKRFFRHSLEVALYMMMKNNFEIVISMNTYPTFERPEYERYRSGRVSWS
jgi:hypothetical protein